MRPPPGCARCWPASPPPCERPERRTCCAESPRGPSRTPIRDPAAGEDLLSAAAEGSEPAAAELADAFTGRLEFGTAGLRGALGPGPNRMNRVVVGQAAAGLAAYLLDHGLAGGRVIIGYDARHNSDVFAADTAEIMAGAGFARAGHGPARCPLRWWPSASATSPAWPGWWSPPRTTRRRTTATRSTSVTARRSCRRPTRRSRPGSTRSPSSRLDDVPRSIDYAALGDELVDAYLARAASLVPPDAPRAVRVGLHPAARGRRIAGRAGGGGRPASRPARWWPSRPSPIRTSPPSPSPTRRSRARSTSPWPGPQEVGRRPGHRQRPGCRPVRRGDGGRRALADAVAATSWARCSATTRCAAAYTGRTPARSSPARCWQPWPPPTGSPSGTR